MVLVQCNNYCDGAYLVSKLKYHLVVNITLDYCFHNGRDTHTTILAKLRQARIQVHCFKVSPLKNIMLSEVSADFETLDVTDGVEPTLL